MRPWLYLIYLKDQRIPSVHATVPVRLVALAAEVLRVGRAYAPCRHWSPVNFRNSR